MRRVLLGLLMLQVLAFSVACGSEEAKNSGAVGTSGASDEGKAVTVGSAPQKTPEALYAAFEERLGKRDYAGVCALFSASGVGAFIEDEHAADCQGAAINHVKDLSDATMSALADGDHKPHTSTVESASASMSNCSVGVLDMTKLEKGWLITDYSSTPGYC
jgi:hypothetical protein